MGAKIKEVDGYGDVHVHHDALPSLNIVIPRARADALGTDEAIIKYVEDAFEAGKLGVPEGYKVTAPPPPETPLIADYTDSLG